MNGEGVDGVSNEQRRAEWEAYVSQCHAKGFCEFSGMSVVRCQRTICDCFETPEGAAEIERAARWAETKQPEVGKVEWFRTSYGVITNGIGWEVVKETPDSPDHDPTRPWSLWHHGEYVGNYEHVEHAKADVDTSDCSKCETL